MILIFCIALIALPVGKIRLGGPNAKPEHSRASWFAMLFAAGMGIGLMFWGVAEPMAYFTDWAGTPFGVEGWTEEAASLAMSATVYLPPRDTAALRTEGLRPYRVRLRSAAGCESPTKLQAKKSPAQGWAFIRRLG